MKQHNAYNWLEKFDMNAIALDHECNGDRLIDFGDLVQECLGLMVEINETKIN